MKSRRKTWLAIASDKDLKLLKEALYYIFDSVYFPLSERDTYINLNKDIKKEIEYRQMLKKR